MKNRVFFVGFEEDLPLEDVLRVHYKVEYVSELFDWVACHASAIFLDPSLTIPKSLNFFGPIYILDTDLRERLVEQGLRTLNDLVGLKRLVNPRQFEFQVGSVVRSKVDPRLGAGVVNSYEDGNLEVTFVNAKEHYSKESIQCHPSSLRVITHIGDKA